MRLGAVFACLAVEPSRSWSDKWVRLSGTGELDGDLFCEGVWESESDSRSELASQFDLDAVLDGLQDGERNGERDSGGGGDLDADRDGERDGDSMFNERVRLRLDILRRRTTGGGDGVGDD